MAEEIGFYLVQRSVELGDLASRLDFKQGIRGLGQGLRDEEHSVLIRVLWEESNGSDEYTEVVMVCVPPISESNIGVIKLAGYEIIKLSKEEYEFVLRGGVKK